METLWSSWVIRSLSLKEGKKDGVSFYFAGDTGYRAVPKGFSGDVDELPHCPEFKAIGDRYGPFTLAAIPIGAYSPRWFMSPVHCDPYVSSFISLSRQQEEQTSPELYSHMSLSFSTNKDAVCVHSDVRAQKSVAMHWGTFILTDEDPREPPQKLKEALRKYNKNQDEFITLNIGESLDV